MTQLKSILPRNMSELEHDLDRALARIQQINIPIDSLWNPWTCPLEVLPYLAWALSVDVWRSNWSEQVKRQVVASSIAVHKVKGTRPAVDAAVGALGLNIKVVEWFQQQPRGQPGTFSVRVDMGDQPLSNDLLQVLVQAIKTSKRATMHYEGVDVVYQAPSKARLISYVKCGEYLKVLPRKIIDIIAPPLALKVAAGVRVQSTITILPRVN